MASLTSSGLSAGSGGGGGAGATGWEFISSTDITNVATIDIALGAYDLHKIVIDTIYPATSDQIAVRFRTAGGSVRTGAADYDWSHPTKNQSTTAVSGSRNDAASEIVVGLDVNHTGATYEDNMPFIMDIFNARSSSVRTYLKFQSAHHLAGTGHYNNTGIGKVATAEDNDLIQFLCLGGANIAAGGTIKLYGYNYPTA